jgi:anti-sigma regulatory factor (Ser/Thr protein kinase)
MVVSVWSWRLPSDLAIVRHARRLAGAATRVGAAQTASNIDEAAAELVASELVTNAIVHGAPPVDLEVDTDNGRQVRITVTDGDPTLPTVPPQSPSPTQEGGRGLLMVETLSTAWGLHRTADGKQVWCEIGSCRDDSDPTP